MSKNLVPAPGTMLFEAFNDFQALKLTISLLNSDNAGEEPTV
jgi:hypothetical protein